ncbi:MAG: hypothetical protein GXP35_04035 [Actinobacteria bacterium]|nr:hypothetical protein [Actinomycetota bacterium]
MRPDPMIPEDRPDRLRSALRLTAGLALLMFFAMAATPLLLEPSRGEVLTAPVAGPPSVVVATASNNSGLSSRIAAAQVIETFEVFGGKNPFERPTLLPSGASRVDTSSTTTPDGTPVTTTPADGSSGGTATDADTADTTTTTQPVEVDPIRNQVIGLVEVFDDNGTVTATVKVGSTVYRVQKDQVFEGSYKVVSLDIATGCGTFLFGDVPFDLCEGQEILK